MWFAFGLITLTCAFGISLIVRLNSRWRGKIHVAEDGTRYLYLYSNQRYRTRPLLRLGMSTRAGCRFTVRKETGTDDWFKSIGIAREFHCGDGRFDDRLYVESDNARIGLLLRNNEEYRNLLLEILDTAEDCGLGFSSIRCARHRVWVELHPGNRWSGPDVDTDLLSGLLKSLSRLLAEELPHHRVKDPFVVRAALLLSVSTAFAVFGGVIAIRVWTGPTDILDWAAPLKIAVLPGLGALAAYATGTLLILGRGSRTHLVLVEVLLVGGFGFVATAYATVREINMIRDQSPPQVIELTDFRIEKRRDHLARRQTRYDYYLLCPDWRDPSKELELQISNQTYFELDLYKRGISIVYRHGAMGMGWIERMDTVSMPSS